MASTRALWYRERMSQETSAVVFLMFLLCLLILWAVVRLVHTSFTVSQCVVVVFCLLIARLLWRTNAPKQLLMKGRAVCQGLSGSPDVKLP